MNGTRSITEYKSIIKNIPVGSQLSKAKKLSWIRLRSSIISNSFLSKIRVNEDYLLITRDEIFNEKDIKDKIVKILIWGYPNTGRGRNIVELFKNISAITDLMRKKQAENLSRMDFNDFATMLDAIPYLGISTWSKFLYFFKIKINDIDCQIFDYKIIKAIKVRTTDRADG